MAKPRKLPAPPIIEAVLDLRVAFTQPPSMDALAAVGPELHGYSEASRLQADFRVQVIDEKAHRGAAAAHTPMPEIGIGYKSADGKYVVQCRRSGLSVSRLRPYEDWEPLFDETMRAWQAYRSVLRPERVKRVSTRFINQIEIPAGRDLDDYLTIGPRLPEGSPNFIGQFSSVVTFPFAEQHANAVVRLTMGMPMTAAAYPVILDLDILQECDLAPADELAIGAGLGALRPLKNQVFFGSLTEKAMGLFQ